MKKEKTLRTLITLSSFFIVIFFLIEKTYILYIAFSFLLIGLFDNPLANIISKSWLSFSELLGKISSFILLSIIFFLILTPVAFLWKIFNKESLAYFFDDSLSSYFKENNIDFNSDYFEKKW